MIIFACFVPFSPGVSALDEDFIAPQHQAFKRKKKVHKIRNVLAHRTEESRDLFCEEAYVLQAQFDPVALCDRDFGSISLFAALFGQLCPWAALPPDKTTAAAVPGLHLQVSPLGGGRDPQKSDAWVPGTDTESKHFDGVRRETTHLLIWAKQHRLCLGYGDYSDARKFGWYMQNAVATVVP